MNPETKIILDELSKRFDEFESKWGTRFSDAEEKLDARFAESEDKWEHHFANMEISHDARVSALERAVAACEDWRPDIEGTVDDMRLEVGKLNKHWEKAVLDRNPPPLLPTAHPAGGRPSPLPFPMSSSAAGRSPAAGEADGPDGHRVNNYLREDGFGSVTTLIHPPGKVAGGNLLGREAQRV